MTRDSNDSLMKGFPPDAANLVTLENWRWAPFNRWGFTHVRELIPTAAIPCDPRNAREFETETMSFDGFEIDHAGERQDLEQWLSRTYTDSMVILKNGKVAYEYYAPGKDAITPHIWMSVSKSLLGLAAGVAADKGYLDVEAAVAEIVPETKGTAYEDATVRQLLDMRAGIDFDENYTTSDGMMAEYRAAHLWGPHTPGETLGDMRSFFARFTKRAGAHGDRFHYISPNTDLLGWIIERVTRKRFCDFVSETIWKPMGAMQEGYITVDRLGAPRTGGGMCGTTRDLARLGRLFATGGGSESRQVISRGWLDDIVNNGDPLAWKNGDFFDLFDGADIHYRSKWYVLREANPLVFGFGVFGQGIFVDRDRDVVIAKNSSQPVPLDPEFMRMTMKGVHALRSILVK